MASSSADRPSASDAPSFSGGSSEYWSSACQQHTPANFCLHIGFLVIWHVIIFFLELALLWCLLGTTWLHLLIPVLSILAHLRLLYFTFVACQCHNQHRLNTWCAVIVHSLGTAASMALLLLVWVLCVRTLRGYLPQLKRPYLRASLGDLHFFGVAVSDPQKLDLLLTRLWQGACLLAMLLLGHLCVGAVAFWARSCAAAEKLDPAELYRDGPSSGEERSGEERSGEERSGEERSGERSEEFTEARDSSADARTCSVDFD